MSDCVLASARTRCAPALAILLAAAACEPLTCQGRVTDNIQAVAIDDVPVLGARCPDGDFDGDVDIDNQAELDTLVGCNTIRGSVIIHDSRDITDLAALATLQRLDNGYLLLLNNSALTTANLPALINLDDGFTAIDNPELTQINVPELPVLKGDLTLRNNAKLAQISFPKVEQVQTTIALINGAPVAVSVGNVILGELPALLTLQGSFPLLERIEGALEVYATGLQNFQGLEALQEIKNQGGAAQARTKFRVDGLNPGLSVGIDFDDGFNIVAAGNPNLENFAGLDALDVIEGDIVVGFNPALEDFTGLEDIKKVANGDKAASFYVFENDGLTSFLGLEGDADGDDDNDGLDTITGSLFVGVYFDRFGQPIAGGNDSLENLDGLDQLVAINSAAPGAGLPKGLILGFNDAFASLKGLDTLATLPGDLVLLGSQQLEDLKGALVLSQIGGSLVFGQLLRRDGQPFDPAEDTEELKLKDGAGVVKDPGVKFDAEGGQNGFDALTTVGRDLVVAFSDLADLHLSDPDGPDDDGVGAANLTTVNGRLVLYGNAAPNDLTGVETIATLGGLVVNFAVDAFGELQPFPNNGFNDFTALAVANLGAGGLHLGFDDNLDDAALATLPDFGNVAGSVTLARAQNQGDLGPSSLAELNIGTIGGDLVVCAVKNGDSDPIDADLGNLEALALDATTTVGGDFVVAFCSNLANTTTSVADVAGTFELTTLPELEEVAGLTALASAGEVLLHDLPAVTTVTIPALAEVDGNLELVDNPALTSFDFGLTTVGGTLRLVGLGELVNVDGLDTLTSVGGDLELIDCDALENTAGLNAVTRVGGDLRLRRLESITNQAQAAGTEDLQFDALTEVGGLEITEMNDLEDLAGLQTIARIGLDAAGALFGTGTLAIAGNPKLATLFGLQGLVAIGRKISIVDNPELVAFSFDDDNQDREDDDDDNIFESGFVEAFTTLGVPVLDGDVLIGGQTGVVELRNNPQLDEAEFVDVVVDNLDNFEGFTTFCGNDGSADDDDNDPRTFSRAVCPAATDGVIDLDSGAGEGEGEGE
jgi:hypothetical protein